MSQYEGQPTQWQPAPQRRRRWPWIVGGAVAVFLLLCGGIAALAGGGTEQPAAQHAPVATTQAELLQTPLATDAPVATKAPAKAPTAPKPAPKKLTAAQEQAIGTAEDYLDTGHFSRQGLIHQLKYEGFSTADATYGVDSLKVDWNAQAVGMAKDYLSYSHFSRQGLIHQLEYEGFTTAQAKHGATGAGL